MAEETCPLCGKARPKGALKCLCNYTFEYGPAERTRSVRDPAAGRSGGDSTAAVVLVAAVVGGAVAMFAFGESIARARVDIWMAVFCIAVGAFSIAGGALGWRWFMSARRARMLTFFLGSTGARCLYGFIGGGVGGIGIAMLL